MDKKKFQSALEEIKTITESLIDFLADSSDEVVEQKDKIVVIEVGHSETQPGATNVLYNVDEWEYNMPIAKSIAEVLSKKYTVHIIDRGHASIGDECKRINKLKPHVIVSLHFNSSSTPTSTGIEVLFWASSTKSKKLATIANEEVTSALSLKNRGIKGLGQGDRGAQFLRDTAAPCIIVEPFFGNNLSDCAVHANKIAEYINAIVQTVDRFFREV